MERAFAEKKAFTEERATAGKRVSTEERASEKENASANERATAQLLHLPYVKTIVVALTCYTGLVLLFGFPFVLVCLLFCLMLLR